MQTSRYTQSKHPTHTGKYCDALQHMLQHTLQHTVTHPRDRGAWHQLSIQKLFFRFHPQLQHTATHCNAPQHTATHCNTHTIWRRLTRTSHTKARLPFPSAAATHYNNLQHTHEMEAPGANSAYRSSSPVSVRSRSSRFFLAPGRGLFWGYVQLFCRYAHPSCCLANMKALLRRYRAVVMYSSFAHMHIPFVLWRAWRLFREDTGRFCKYAGHVWGYVGHFGELTGSFEHLA